MTLENNAGAHLKRMIVGCEVAVRETQGNLDYGTYEQLFNNEFDIQYRKTFQSR